MYCEVVKYHVPDEYIVGVLIYFLILIITDWVIFTKLQDYGWKSVVPIYSIYTKAKLSWGSGWMFLTYLIPIVGFIFILIGNYKLCSRFGKGKGFSLLYSLVPCVFGIVLALSSPFNSSLNKVSRKPVSELKDRKDALILATSSDALEKDSISGGIWQDDIWADNRDKEELKDSIWK